MSANCPFLKYLHLGGRDQDDNELPCSVAVCGLAAEIASSVPSLSWLRLSIKRCTPHGASHIPGLTCLFPVGSVVRGSNFVGALSLPVMCEGWFEAPKCATYVPCGADPHWYVEIEIYHIAPNSGEKILFGLSPQELAAQYGVRADLWVAKAPIERECRILVRNHVFFVFLPQLMVSFPQKSSMRVSMLLVCQTRLALWFV